MRMTSLVDCRGPAAAAARAPLLCIAETSGTTETLSPSRLRNLYYADYVKLEFDHNYLGQVSISAFLECSQLSFLGFAQIP